MKERSPILAAVAEAEYLERALGSSAQLAATSSAIVRLATEARCGAVVGASPVGDRLAGAAVATALNGLRIFDPSVRTDRVLVVDGLLVSGVQLSRAVRAVHQSGARYVIAVAVTSAHEDPARAVAGADNVVVLDAAVVDG